MKNPYGASSFRVTSPYGRRRDPFTGALSFHSGVDLVCPEEDAEVYAVSGGVVARSRAVTDPSDRTSEWGQYVAVAADGGETVYYCHLSRRCVRAGDRIAAGTVIGAQGATGRVTGPHLHLEVRRGFVTVDAASYLGIKNEAGPACGVENAKSPESADISDREAVARRAGLAAETVRYLDAYRYSADLWRKLRAATEARTG